MSEPIDLEAIRAELDSQMHHLDNEVRARSDLQLSSLVEILRAVDFELLRQQDKPLVAGLALALIRALLLNRLEKEDDE